VMSLEGSHMAIVFLMYLIVVCLFGGDFEHLIIRLFGVAVAQEVRAVV